MGNYVIRRQSDGEVYLAHAGTASVPKTERPGHKYILRLLTRAGARYFYTPEQVRAYYNSVKAKAGDPLGFKAYSNAMKKGTKVITTQGQENTAKWKVEKKPTAENKNNYERAKAANNYAQRDYYDAKKESEKGAFGKLSSALKGKSSGNEQKPDQNGRSRGQSNLYKTDKYGNTYRPGVIDEKQKPGKEYTGEKGTAKVTSNGDHYKVYSGHWLDREDDGQHMAKLKDSDIKAYMQSAFGSWKDQKGEPDWKDNRPEGRKRNVAGKAEPIEKKSEGVVKGNKEKAADLQKKLEHNNESMLKLRKQAWEYEDEYYDLRKELDKLQKSKNDMTTSEYGIKYGEISKKRKELWDKANEAWDEFDALYDESGRIRDEIDSMKVER